MPELEVYNYRIIRVINAYEKHMECLPDVDALIRLMQIPRAKLLYRLRQMGANDLVESQRSFRHGTMKTVYMSNVTDATYQE